MATPKERLEEAGHKLAGSAEYVETLTEDSANPGRGNAENMKGQIQRALDDVKQRVIDVEKIIQ